ncbi:M4 family metallopeptidase [Tumebacillus sp. BK434]|uniref:M4 family metallopeptidase n=1 Tax=Tumebacillus sp. BK434 TaxID=2512169 RepID=UPI00140523E6|nr:M4 family metallopeptidase [Tumebacillus sp. BK434]
MSGKLSSRAVRSDADAVAVLEENRDLFHLDSAQLELTPFATIRDEYGQAFKFRQTYKGVPVFGNELIVHTDAAGAVTSINGYYDPVLKIKGMKVKPSLSANQAMTRAKQALKVADAAPFDLQEANLAVYEASEGKYHLVYLVTLSTLEGTPVYADVFVDAHDGSVIDVISKLEPVAAVAAATGVLDDAKTVNTDLLAGLYYLSDTTKPMFATGGKIDTYSANYGLSLPGTLISNTDNVWTDKAAVDAHYYAGLVYDYYYREHGRNSYDNNGATIKSTVHYSANYNNAFWNGSQMVYGDGDGKNYLAFSGALDVVGHELTHAVTTKTAGLIYQDQSGALSESFSDVFGELIENKPNNNWLVGEAIVTPGVEGDAMRSLANPEAYSHPDHMSKYVYTSADNGAVHTNSGIPNKAFYNVVTAPGMTQQKAGKVWYRALTQYLTSKSIFNDARNATRQAAIDLYGAGSAEVAAVVNAWESVGVNDATGDPFEPNNSMESAYAPMISDTTYNGRITSATDEDWFKFSPSANGSVTVVLNNMAYDYDLAVYDANSNLIGQSMNRGNAAETVAFSGTAGANYYVKVVGYNGAQSSTSVYTLKATFPTVTTNKWFYETLPMDTPHPYPVNYNNRYQHTYKKQGAQKVALHFSRFETEHTYDYVQIRDKNDLTIYTYTGTLAGFWVTLDGDEASAILFSDSSVTAFGYTIDQVAYYNPTAIVSPGVLAGEVRTTFEHPIEE